MNNKSQVSECCGAYKIKVKDYHFSFSEDSANDFLCRECGNPFIPQQEEKGCCNHCVFNNGRDYKHADNCPCHSPQQEEKCCLRCNAEVTTKGFETGCINRLCPCHSPQTESGEKKGFFKGGEYCDTCNEKLEPIGNGGYRHNCSQSPNSGEKEDPKPDINKVKCSCGQYYAMLDHCCYPWVGDFNRECGFIFSGSLGQLHKEKVKSFISQLITSTRLAERGYLLSKVCQKCQKELADSVK